MDPWLASSINRLRETHPDLAHLLYHVIEQIADISVKLDEQKRRPVRPIIPAPKFEWSKWGPRIWWGLLAMGLVIAKLFDLPEVAAILSKLH